MNKPQPGNQSYQGSEFERIFIACLAVVTAAILIYLTIAGPMYQKQISFKTHPDVIAQVIAQDAVNMYFLAPILLIAAWGLLNRKRWARYWLISTPLFLIYYALSYGIGWEWMAPNYQGNSHFWFFYYLEVLIAALLMMIYGLGIFPAKQRFIVKKLHLRIYSVLLGIFKLMFGAMWLKEIFQLYAEGTTRGYEIAPTAFWLVRMFDLGFSIPLALLSIYLLWTRPDTSFALQMLMYGFFLTMSVVVNAMGFMMWLSKDPAYDPAGTVIFAVLMLLSVFGFVFVLRGYLRKH